MQATEDRGFLKQAPWAGLVFGGSWEVAQGGACDVIEPATGRVLTRTGFANAADVAAAARVAAAAQKAWAASAPRDRVEVLTRAFMFFQHHAESIASFIARETGGLLAKGQHEVREAIWQLKQAASLILQPQGFVLPSTPGRLSYAKRVPHGVVGVISPFNFPLILSMRSVAPALALGNAVVLKPDARTPASGGFFLAQAFEEAGLPRGLLHVLPGGAEAGEALCSDRNVQMVCFTGSTATGRRVAALAGGHLKKVALELGGKNSLVVLDDADLDRAASCVAFASYLHQGQICMATGRVLVHEKVAPELTRRLAEKASHLPVGDPAREQVALGPLFDERQRDRVHAIVEEAVSEGAKLEAGGAYDRLFYRPTVLSGVRPSMRAFREEVFGPVASLTTFASDDEAISLANEGDGAIAAGVLSKSVARATAIADRLEAGHVHVNDQTVADDVNNPFGGRGSAGNGGRMGGPADIEQYTQWKWCTVRDEPPPYPF